MFPLTKEERLVLIFLGFVFLFGTILQYCFKTNPQFRESLNFIDSDRVYQKIDLNTATVEELEALPYIGRITAQRIISHRTRYGPFKSVEELRSVEGISLKTFQEISRFLKVTISRSFPNVSVGNPDEATIRPPIEIRFQRDLANLKDWRTFGGDSLGVNLESK